MVGCASLSKSKGEGGSKHGENILEQARWCLQTVGAFPHNKTSFTSEDIINFIKKLNPATFVYKSNKDEYSDIVSALNSNHTDTADQFKSLEWATGGIRISNSTGSLLASQINNNFWISGAIFLRNS